MKHHYQTTLLFLLLTTAALAQTFKPTSNWRAGSSGQDGIWDIAIDTAGNQYICGIFTGTVDVDPGPGVYNLTQPSGQTQEDAFLLKLDASGNFVWAKHFGGSLDSRRNGIRVESDYLGNVYVVGLYAGNIKFEPNGTIWTAPGGNPNSPFIAKFTSTGALVWGYGWSCTNLTVVTNITIDNQLNVYAVGGFEGTVDFDPRSGSSNVIQKTSSGIADMFLMKINSTGVFKSVKTLGSSGDDLFSSVAIQDNGYLYLTGSFSGTVDFNWNAGTVNKSAINAADCFIMKTDTALNFKWVKTFGGLGNEYNRKIISKDSLLINYGVFYQNIDLDPSSMVTTNFQANGGKDNFVQMLDTAGNLLWAKTFGGTGNEEAYRLGINANSELLLSGYYENTVDFDPSVTSDYLLTSNGYRDGFVLKLDINGDFLNAASFGSSHPTGTEDMVVTSSTLPFDVAGGSFYNTIDINPSSLVTQNVTSAGQDDMLYLKLESCTNALVQSTATACGSNYQLPSGNMVYASGYYLDTVLSTQGCDSVNAITLTLNPLPNATVTQTGATFTAQPGLTYQWLNCQTNQPIAGETNQTFTATTNGQYAVMVSNGNCTDTSVCYSITNIGMHEAHMPAVSLYPNPTTGLLNMSSPQPWQKAEVTDLLGRTVLTQPEPKEALDLGKLPTGIYLVKVFFTEGVVVQRVVKR